MPQPLLAVVAGAFLAQSPHEPGAPAGFTVDLVLQHPDVKWPSAVHCRADGALLVAEDPMDMPGPTDQPLDRIWLLRFAPDGTFTKTLFAEQLFAVMGLQEIDDAIYVMNMPHLTILRDRDGDGVAEERRELLTDLGPVAPGWPGGFNDHIVSGLRLGMDGFLYVSVGDKGVPLAHGSDGSEITLRGGGVVRVRPDGTQLEIVASGTRNHLDVAMDAQDHLFTYDNTDDGLGWWTRLTHVMPTGYYGYPWDYHDHPERMLPCMKDDGGGSPVGGLVYRGDAWPTEYQGDLFYCEWADRVVRRFKVERAGATFQCTLTEDFITPGESGEFRPLDICESQDGRYLYIADWNFPGWTDPTEAGRVWRVRRTDDPPGAKPFGALRDGTLASLAKASVEDLLKNLGHPAFALRLAAQRELARRRDVIACAGLMSDPKGELRARCHALWAIDGGCARDREFDRPLRGDAHFPSVRELVEKLLDDPEPELRAEAARALGLRRSPCKALGVLVATDPDLAVRREAAIAIGRGGDGSQLWPLVRALETSDDLFVRFAVRQAIRALPCDWSVLVQKFLPMASPRVQEDLWLALREVYDLELAGELAHATENEFYSPSQRACALAVLAEAHRKLAPWDGKWWQTQPAKSGRPLKTVEWEGTFWAVTEISRAFRSDEPELRAAALAALRTTHEPQLFGDLRGLIDAALDPAERVALLQLVSELGDPKAAVQFRRALIHVDPRVRVAGIVALERLQGAEALADVEPRLADDDAQVRAAAIEVFARHPDARVLDDYLRGVALGGTTRDACRGALAALRSEIRPRLEAKATAGELDPATLALVREIYDQPQPLLQWQLFGPFARDFHDAALESAGGPGSPSGSGTVASASAVEAALPHGFVDLKAKFGDAEQQCAYALATLESPVARSARCFVGSDDGVTVWVNGVKVHENPGDRGWTPDADRVEIALAAGPNEILLRVEQAGGDWSFNVKVSELGSGPLFTSAPTAVGAADFDLAQWRDFALANAGDAARGKTLFFAEGGAACFRCHAIAGAGPKLGPDLQDVGKKYPRAELVTSILEPSQRIQEGYTATHVFLKDGDVLSGLVAGEKDGLLSLADATGAVRELRLDDVKEKRASKLSAMPTGLAEKLTRQEFADLIAWLETLKQ